jgi:MerR family transcriptional regulator, light-induced transcriptional regulator
MSKYEEFKSIVNQLDQHKLYFFVEDLVKARQLTLLELYDWITRVLIETVPLESSDLSIFDEHVKVNALKSLLAIRFNGEQCPSRKVMICTLHEEQHDLGMAMIDNYLTINNQLVMRSGADTPIPSIIAGIGNYQPDFLIVSVTNFYHLTKLNDLLASVRQLYPHLKIIVGGVAVNANKATYEAMGLAGVGLTLPQMLFTITGGGQC